MLNHLTLSYLYLAVLAITPSYLLSKAFRFALMPAFQIYLDNDAQARFGLKYAPQLFLRCPHCYCWLYLSDGHTHFPFD